MQFFINPKRSHIGAVRWLVSYLIGTKNKGCCVNLDSKEGLEICVGTDFSSNCDPEEAKQNRETTQSYHSYIIACIDVPITWKS